MSMEEEHEKLHGRGELVKFAALVVVLLLTVLVISGLRPLIFDHIVPAVLGWDDEPSQPAGAPIEEAEPSSQETTLPSTLTATTESEPEQDDEEAIATPELTSTPQPEPSSTPVTYEVQGGDRLIDIAENFDVSIEAIVQANGIADPNRIQAGDVLVIPTP